MPNVRRQTLADNASITAADLKPMITDGSELALIDVREQGVFGQGHLLYAVCVPLSQMELRIRELLPRLGVRIVVMDGGDGATTAVTAAQRLAGIGYRDVAVLADGLAGCRL